MSKLIPKNIGPRLVNHFFISKHRYGSVSKNKVVKVVNFFSHNSKEFVCIDCGAYAIPMDEFFLNFTVAETMNLTYEIDDASELYLRSCGIETSDAFLRNISNHARHFEIKSPQVCAYYDNRDDFCSDWCDDIGYTRTQAWDLLHGSQQKGEFMILPNNMGIIRFVC